MASQSAPNFHQSRQTAGNRSWNLAASHLQHKTGGHLGTHPGAIGSISSSLFCGLMNYERWMRAQSNNMIPICITSILFTQPNILSYYMIVGQGIVYIYIYSCLSKMRLREMITLTLSRVASTRGE